jgi:hypothetical protein
LFKWDWFVAVPVVLVFLLGFSASISLTRFIAYRVAKFCGTGSTRNSILFGVFTTVNYLLLVFVTPLLEVIKVVVINLVLDLKVFVSKIRFVLPFIWSNVSDEWFVYKTNVEDITGTLFLKYNPYFSAVVRDIDMHALYMLELFPVFLRLAISIVFLCSFLLRPVIMRPVSLLWARILESDKPVFTVVFGGAAAFASAIGEAAKHL